MKVALSLIEKSVDKEKRAWMFPASLQAGQKGVYQICLADTTTKLYLALLPTSQYLPAKIFTYPFHQCYADKAWHQLMIQNTNRSLEWKFSAFVCLLNGGN